VVNVPLTETTIPFIFLKGGEGPYRAWREGEKFIPGGGKKQSGIYMGSQGGGGLEKSKNKIVYSSSKRETAGELAKEHVPARAPGGKDQAKSPGRTLI